MIWQGGKASDSKTVRPSFDSQHVQGFFPAAVNFITCQLFAVCLKLGLGKVHG